MHRAALRNFLGEVLEKNESFCAGPNRARTKPSAGSSTLRANASGVMLSVPAVLFPLSGSRFPQSREYQMLSSDLFFHSGWKKGLRQD